VYQGNDAILLQVIVCQHLVEPTVVPHPDIRREIHADFNVDDLKLLEHTDFGVPGVHVYCSDGRIDLVSYLHADDTYTSVYRPYTRNDEIEHPRGHILERHMCTFDFYRQRYTDIFQRYPNTKMHCGQLEMIYMLPATCAVLTLEQRINLSWTLPYEAFQLLENAKLKSLKLDVSQYTSQLREPRFQPGCEIENFIVSPSGMPQCVSILTSLVQHSRTLRRVRVDFDAEDRYVETTARDEVAGDANKRYENLVVTRKDVASSMLAVLFNPANIERLNVMIHMKYIRMLDDRTVVPMAKYMGQIYSRQILNVIIRNEQTLFDFPKVYQAVRNINRGDRFENMINYMWQKYTTIFDAIPLDDEDGFDTAMGGRFEKDTVPDRQTYDPFDPDVETGSEIFPILRDKDALRRIVRHAHGDRMSLSQIFTYLMSFNITLRLVTEDEYMPELDYDPDVHNDEYVRQLLREGDEEVTSTLWDVYSPDPYAIQTFFESERVDHVGMVHVSDAVFMNELEQLFRVMETRNTINRIRTIDKPELHGIVPVSEYTEAPLVRAVSKFLG
jgi:hypothetical protein